MITDLLNVRVAGVNGWTPREDHRFDSLDSGALEGCLGLFTSDGPGVLVGDNDDLRITEEFLEDAPGFLEHVAAHDHDVRVAAIGQRFVNQFGHCFSSDQCDRQFCRPRDRPCHESWGTVAGRCRSTCLRNIDIPRDAPGPAQ